MRVFVTFPYSSPHDPMNCEYVAEVVRVEELPKGKFGVAVHLKLSVNYGAGAPTDSLTHARLYRLCAQCLSLFGNPSGKKGQPELAIPDSIGSAAPQKTQVDMPGDFFYFQSSE